MRQRVIYILAWLVLAATMTTGWHTWMPATFIAFWLLGYHITEDNIDAELRRLLNG